MKLEESVGRAGRCNVRSRMRRRSCGEVSVLLVGLGFASGGCGSSGTTPGANDSGLTDGPASVSDSSGVVANQDSSAPDSTSPVSDGDGAEANQDSSVTEPDSSDDSEAVDSSAAKDGTVNSPDTSTVSASPYPYIFSCFDDDNTHLSDLMIYTSNDALN
jgi:hypothetical protein